MKVFITNADTLSMRYMYFLKRNQIHDFQEEKETEYFISGNQNASFKLIKKKIQVILKTAPKTLMYVVVIYIMQDL